MRERRHFTRAVAITVSVMSASALAVGSIGYWRLGAHFDHTLPITSILPQVVDGLHP